MKTTLISLASLLLLSLWAASCSSGAGKGEAEGYACLSEARAALRANRYDEAKRIIDSLRTHYPLALNAREEGILLLDSVNLAEAHVELQAVRAQLDVPDLDRIARDTLSFNLDEAEQKVRFFERKIEHDKANLLHHDD